MPEAVKAETPQAPVLTLDEDPRFARWPKVRHAMILIVGDAKQGGTRVTVTETKDGGLVRVEDGGYDRTAQLNVLELRTLAAFCNRVARRVAKRPDHHP